MLSYHLWKLQKYTDKTGFQIPPNVCGPGLTIYHVGSIIVNGNVKIGRNCKLYSGVLIGWQHPGEPCAQIGDDVFIGSGAKIIGNVHIGSRVTIGQNCVITHDIPDDTTVVVDNRGYRYLASDITDVHGQAMSLRKSVQSDAEK